MKLNKLKKYLLIIFALIASVIILNHEIQSINSQEWIIFDGFITLGWYLLFLIISIPTLHYSIRNLKRSKSNIYYVPIIILGITILTTITIQIFIHSESNSPVILRAHYDGDTNGLSLKLRENGTYNIHNYSIIGGDYINGTFKIENDTIYLDQDQALENDFMSNKLVITEDKILFSIDKNGKYETGYFTMKIIENNIKTVANKGE
jgi:hypothetical protein